MNDFSGSMDKSNKRIPSASETKHTVEVRGMKETTSSDTIRYYFESRRGANCDVIDIRFVPNKNMYLVSFGEIEGKKGFISFNLFGTYLQVEGKRKRKKYMQKQNPPRKRNINDSSTGMYSFRFNPMNEANYN